MTSVYERVRVEDPSTGHQFTTTRVHAETAGLTVLDKAADKNGRPIPALTRTDLAGHPAPRKSAEPKEVPANNEKENV